jgi:hypothetical protein
MQYVSGSYQNYQNGEKINLLIEVERKGGGVDVFGGDSISVDGSQHRGEKGRGDIGGLYLTS